MFKWIGITDAENMPEIRRILEMNHIKVEFMDAGNGEVRVGVPKKAKESIWIMSNFKITLRGQSAIGERLIGTTKKERTFEKELKLECCEKCVKTDEDNVLDYEARIKNMRASIRLAHERILANKRRIAELNAIEP